MKVSRGDIFNVKFKFPDGSFLEHPTLVISRDSVYKDEGMFIGVLISGKPEIDKYSFKLKEEHFQTPPKKECQVRCHFVALITKEDVQDHNPVNKLRGPCIDQIAQKICKEIIN